MFRVSIAEAAATYVSGFWAVAGALRREDGSIGQQGLVFSPLLREKTGFADPSREELTLLLYGEEAGDAAGESGPPVLLHVVFGSVSIERTPEEAGPPESEEAGPPESEEARSPVPEEASPPEPEDPSSP